MIFGIIWGLYIKFSIIPIFFIFAIIFFALKRNNRKIRKYFKLLFRKSLIIFTMSIIIGEILVNIHEKEWCKIYENEENIEVNALLLSDSIEKQYFYEYEIKIQSGKNNGRKFILKVKKEKSSINLKYGQKIHIKGIYKDAEIQRNTFGFDYKKYLKSQNIYGSIVAKKSNIKIENEKGINNFFISIHIFKSNLSNKLKNWLPESSSGLIIGLILGDKNYLSEETKENFTNSSLAHLLVISGTHISYIVLGMTFLFKKLNCGKKLSYTLSCIVLILFSTMVGFSPSVIRATIMGILFLVSKIIYEKSDTYTNMSFSLIVILIQNPYSIWDIGLQLSYLATIGIIFFYPILISKMNEKSEKYKFLKETMAISVSAQIFIIPILANTFHKFSIHFIISNIFATPLFAIAILFGTITLILGSLNDVLGQILSIVLNFDLKLLTWVSELMGKTDWGNILVTRLNIVIYLVYFLIFIFIKYFYTIISRKKTWENLNKIEKTEQRFANKLEKNKEKFIKLGCLFILIILSYVFISKLFPTKLEIHFIDVGQGDGMLIQTVYHKNILVDGGGNLEKESYDVGKNTVVPYLLNKGIKKVDYIMISHFDKDHAQTCVTVLKELRVSGIILSEQFEENDVYTEIISIAKKKKVKLIYVKAGDVLNIDGMKINILHPQKELISDNFMNNNSIVCKIEYKSFSMLLTGDIEKEAESLILSKNVNLKADVLKVAHHGSKTSSTQEFLNAVKPKIALIGVGKYNTFRSSFWRGNG